MIFTPASAGWARVGMSQISEIITGQDFAGP
jgi:hypothetical protein